MGATLRVSYHAKATYKFLRYLQDHFKLYTPINLYLQPEVTFPTKNAQGHIVNNWAIGTTQLHRDGSCTIRLSTNKIKTRKGFIFSLAHEFGHVVQFSKGFKPDSRNVDWRKEIEATKIGFPVAEAFMKEHYSTFAAA